MLHLCSGIGAACALALAQAGASLCLVARPPRAEESVNTAVATLREKCPSTRVEVVYCDLSNMDDVKGIFQQALDRMGGQIHVLVNCAGIQRRAPSLDFSEQDWDDVSVFNSISTPLVLGGNAFQSTARQRHRQSPNCPICYGNFRHAYLDTECPGCVLHGTYDGRRRSR